MERRIDPITFTVVAGLIESTTREMTVILERTARSPILKVAHFMSKNRSQFIIIKQFKYALRDTYPPIA